MTGVGLIEIVLLYRLYMNHIFYNILLYIISCGNTLYRLHFARIILLHQFCRGRGGHEYFAYLSDMEWRCWCALFGL